MLSGGETESYTLGVKMGIATFMLWFSLSKYLTFQELYAHLPNTFIGSAREVTYGTISMFPFFIGVSYMSTVMLYMDFRFRDCSYSSMTMFYNMQGDTMFDTL